MRVTADTNIYISALNLPGVSQYFSPAGGERGDQAVRVGRDPNGDRRNTKKQIPVPPDRIIAAIEALSDITDRIRPTVALNVVTEDPDDNKILECAQTANADYVVTGDRHLLKLRQYDGTPIITVTEFLSRFRQDDLL